MSVLFYCYLVEIPLEGYCEKPPKTFINASKKCLKTQSPPFPVSSQTRGSLLTHSAKLTHQAGLSDETAAIVTNTGDKGEGTSLLRTPRIPN